MFSNKVKIEVRRSGRIKALKTSMIFLQLLIIILSINISACLDYYYILSSFPSSSTIDKIQGAIPGHDAQLLYVSTTFITGENIIKKYDITLQTDILEIGQYEATSNNNVITKMYLHGEYLIGYDPTNTVINVFNESSFAFIGEFDTGLQINQFIDIANIQTIFMTTMDGYTYTIDYTHFPLFTTTPVDLGLPQTPGPCYGAVSYTYDYYAVVSETYTGFILFNLIGAFVQTTPVFWSGFGAKALCWNTGSNTLYIADYGGNYVYQVPLGGPNLYMNTYLLNPNDAGSAYHMQTIRYHPQASVLVAFGKYNLTSSTNQLHRMQIGMNPFNSNPTIQQSSVYDSTSQFQFISEENNVKWFNGVVVSTDTQVSVAFWDSCLSTQYYQYASMSCLACSNACSRCTYGGCTTPNGEGNNLTLPSDMAITSIDGYDVVVPGNDDVVVPQNDTTESPQPSQPSQPSQTTQTYTESDSLRRHIDATEAFIDGTLGTQFVETVNKAPGSRRVFKVFLAFFVNLDDLALYNYHQRRYSPMMQTLFDQIQQLEEQKWELVTSADFLSVVGIDLAAVQSHLQYKAQFSSSKFIEIEGRSNGFLLNTLNFTLSNSIFTVIMFVLLKCLFSLLQHFKISFFLREYAFWQSLFLMAMESNLQYFVYLFMFEMSSLFSFSIGTKALNVLTVLIVFLVFTLSTAFFFYVQKKRRKFIKYFLSNSENRKYGFAVMVGVFAIKNISLGMFHFLFQDSYYTKMCCLLCLEILLISFFVYLLKVSRKSKSKIFCSNLLCYLLYIIPSLLRILLITVFTLSFQSYENLPTSQQSSEILQVYTFVEVFVILEYLIIWILCIVYSTISLSLQIFKFCKAKYSESADSEQIVKPEKINRKKNFQKKVNHYDLKVIVEDLKNQEQPQQTLNTPISLFGQKRNKLVLQRRQHQIRKKKLMESRTPWAPRFDYNQYLKQLRDNTVPNERREFSLDNYHIQDTLSPEKEKQKPQKRKGHFRQKWMIDKVSRG